MNILAVVMRETFQTLNKMDLDLSNRLRLDAQHNSLWRAAVLLAHSGDSWLWAMGIGLVWLLRIGGPEWHRFSAILEVSIVFQALFVFALKGLIRRQRPSGNWGGIYRQVDPHSFPSGHATRAAMLAVLGLGLGPAWFGWMITLWAPLVCASRVITGVHYVSDILGGIILGLFMGLALMAISPLLLQWFPLLINWP